MLLEWPTRFFKPCAGFLPSLSPSTRLNPKAILLSPSLPHRHSQGLISNPLTGGHPTFLCSSASILSMIASPTIKWCAEEEEEGGPVYNWINGVEEVKRYKPGGYHPIIIGDLLHQRYHIVDKLGYGGYSTIWLARETRLNRYVALKVGVVDSHSHEIQALRALSTPLSAHPGQRLFPSIS